MWKGNEISNSPLLWKELGRQYSINRTVKPEQAENQWLFVSPSKNWDCRENWHTKIWRNHGRYKLEGNLNNKSVKLLKSGCGLTLETLGGFSLKGTDPYTQRAFISRDPIWYSQERSPHDSGRGEEQSLKITSRAWENVLPETFPKSIGRRRGHFSFQPLVSLAHQERGDR